MSKLKERKPKIKYRGQFNYRHSIHILYCFASSERGAWKNFMFQLAKKHGVEVWHVMNLFRGQADNYRIEEAGR